MIGVILFLRHLRVDEWLLGMEVGLVSAIWTKGGEMFEVTDSARDEIIRVINENEEKRAVRIYIAGHG